MFHPRALQPLFFVFLLGVGSSLFVQAQGNDTSIYLPVVNRQGAGTGTPATTPSPTATVVPTPGMATIRQLISAPTIDGAIDTLWAQTESHSLTRTVTGTPANASNLSASFRTRYDGANLYLLVEVTDDAKRSDSGDEWWQDDGVEIYLDGNRSAGSSYDGVDDFQLGFRRDDPGTRVGVNSRPAPSGIQRALIDVTGGYRLEVAIPLAATGIRPEDGYRFGLEVHISDDDNGGARERKLSWHSLSDDAWERPASFGLAQLLAQPATPTPTATATVVNPVPTATPTSPPTTIGWRPAGFGGAGAYHNLFFDPSQPGVIYATSDVAGVFRSTDNGATWQLRSRGLGNFEVSSFAIDPFDNQTLYAGVGSFANSSKAGIYISRDAGGSWSHLASTAANDIDFRMHRTRDAIALDPFTRGVIVSGSRSRGIWRSTNAGQSWTQVLLPPNTSVAPFFSCCGGAVVDGESGSYPAPVTAVRFDSGNQNIAYASLYGIGIFKSSNGGASWQASSSGLPSNPTVQNLVVHKNGAIFAALGLAGVYKSSNGGASWQAVNGGMPVGDFHVLSLSTHPSNADILWFAQEYKQGAATFHSPVWQTTDGGNQWAPLNFDLNNDIALDPVNSPPDAWWFLPNTSWKVAVDPNAPSRLFFLLSGIYRSEDSGKHWQNLIKGAQNTCVSDLLVDGDHAAGQPDTLYAAHLDAGLLASSDNGRTWQALMPTTVDQRNDFAGHYWRIAIARSGGVKRWYVTAAPWAQSYNQVLRSTDGVTWSPVFTADTPEGDRGLGQLNLAIDPSQPNLLYLAADGGVVQKSTNHGDSWAATASQPGNNRFNDLLVDHNGRLFASTFFGGLWRSTNGGTSWQQVLNEQSLSWRLAAAPGAVYAAAGDGNLYRSTNGGDTWTNLTKFPIDNSDSDNAGLIGIAVTVNPSNPSHLLFSRYDIWHVSDTGDGVFESTDGGVTWRNLQAGMVYPRANALAIGSDGTRFAGTTCAGVWALDGN